MTGFRFFNFGLLMLFLWVCLAIQTQAQQLLDVQKTSRAEAIARIADLYPNSDKSAEQIYDEGQIEQTARTFSKRFRNRALDALTGPLEEDFEKVVSVRVPPPPVTEVTGRQDSVLAATKVGGIATSDTTGQMPPLQMETKRVKRRSVFQTGHAVMTTVAKDNSDRDKRSLRQAYLSIFDGLPSDVRVVIEPGAVRYHGQTATVDATWEYDIVGHPTRLSRSYQDHAPQPIKLQMRRVGDDWLVSNFQGLVNKLNAEVARSGR